MIDVLPPVLPVFGDGVVPPVSNAMWLELARLHVELLGRDHQQRRRRALTELDAPDLSDAVLSAWMISNESTAFGSAGPGARERVDARLGLAGERRARDG